MIQPGTAVWFARHESRLAWRDWLAMMTAGKAARRRRVALGIAAFVIGMHAVAYFVVGGFAAAVIDKHFLIAVTATILLSWLLMVSQAMESVTRAFYTRADLDLILASPVAVQRLFAVRIATVALAVAAMALPLAGPFINMLAFLGGWHWLGAYGVILAMGAAATAVAVALTVALFRIIGPKRTRLTAQVLAAIIGASFVIGLQVAAILSYGTLSRADVLQSQTLEALAPDLTSAFWWPARAVLGDIPALAAVLAASFVLLAAVIALVAPRFSDYAIAASGAGASPAARTRRAKSFSVASPRAALRRKEWLLLRRDPWLASQTLMQMLYLLPPAILLWRIRSWRRRAQSAGAGAGDGGRPACRRPRLAQHLGRGRARSCRYRADPAALRAARQDRSRDRDHRGDLCAAGRGHRHRLALACGDHRRRHRDRGCVRHRDPALVPHPGQAQPIPPPPGLLARRHFR
jgi:ABC-2 type transport system permease protein